MSSAIPIEQLSVASYTVPTDRPEADGTLDWQATTLVVARLRAGGCEGMGYGYADAATARVIADIFAPQLQGCDALAISARWQQCAVAVRNLGRAGICAMALSIVDTALWDLKGQLMQLPLIVLLGAARGAILAYGSGGFTNYTDDELRSQLGGWAERDFKAVKMKIGRNAARDLQRVRSAREAIGANVDLFVDANGGYRCKEALAQAEAMIEYKVRWFEEPVSSDDIAGLRLLRERGPGNMAIAAGEYGYDLQHFRRLLEAGAVDVLQADATRCGGITGFLAAAALCEAHCIPLSAHCAPALHSALCCAVRPAIHLEYFHDHARIEQMLFDGAAAPQAGLLHAQTDRPGLGLTFKEQDAQCFRD